MAKKKGRSEKKTDWLGRSYIQHYDSSGKKSGRSERKETIFGTKYTQHYDSGGNRTGRSERKETWLGREYTQKYDRDGNKRGTSEKKSTWLGGKYTQHYDSDGRKTDWSEKKETWLGGQYVQRYGDDTTRPGQHYQTAQSSGTGGSYGASYSNAGLSSAATDKHTSALPQSEKASSVAFPTATVLGILLFLTGIAYYRTYVSPPLATIIDIRNYRGTVDNKYPIRMHLRKEGHALTGSYVYLKYKIPIRLSGTIDERGIFTAYGYEKSGKLIDTFTGTLNGGTELTGNMTRQRDKRVMPFHVYESNR